MEQQELPCSREDYNTADNNGDTANKHVTIDQSEQDQRIVSEVPPSKDSMSGQPTVDHRMPGGIGHETSDVQQSNTVVSRRPSDLNSGFLGSRSGGSLHTAITAEVGSFQAQNVSVVRKVQ